MISSPISSTELDAIKAKFPFLLSPALLNDIARKGELFEARKGEVIMNYGSHVRMVPLILEGEIKVMREGKDGEELLLYILGSGDTCSMSFSCCMREKKSSIKTLAEEKTRFIGIPVKFMEEWMGTYPSWRNFVMSAYDERMLELVETIDNIAFKKMDARLLDYLNKKAKSSKRGIITTTHQQIAYDMNASRESISRLLKQLEKANYLSLGRNKILLK